MLVENVFKVLYNLDNKWEIVRREKRIMDVEIKTQTKEFHGRSCEIIKQGNRFKT